MLAPHRGHRLGMRLKLANLVALAEADPSRDRIYTWNADENEPHARDQRGVGLPSVRAGVDVAAAGADAASGAAGSAGTGATSGS